MHSTSTNKTFLNRFQTQHPLRADPEITSAMREVRLSDDISPTPRVAQQTENATDRNDAAQTSPTFAPEAFAQNPQPVHTTDKQSGKVPVAAPPPAAAPSMTASAVGASYGDLLAPPPSYADSMMYSRPPAGFDVPQGQGQGSHQPVCTSAGYVDHRNTWPGMTHTGMMNTVALDGGIGGPGAQYGAGGFTQNEITRDASSTDGNTARLGGSNSTSSLRITITDPQMSSTTGSPFGKKVVTYKVRCVTSDQNYPSKDFITWRRFRDFVSLADLLQVSHKGYFIPPRPEKKPLSTSSDDAFVRDRVTQLGNYLDRLASHPTIRNSNELKVFLTSQDLERDPEWAKFGVKEGAMGGPGMINQSQINQPYNQPYMSQQVPQTGYANTQPNMDSSAMSSTAAGGAYGASPYAGLHNPNTFQSPSAQTSPTSGVGKFFKSLATSTASVAAGIAGAGKNLVTEDDRAYMEERDRVFRLEQELAIASLKAGRCLETNEKFSDALGELGLECVKLAKLEDTDSVQRGEGSYSAVSVDGRDTASRARKMGNAAVRVSRLTRAAVGQLSKSLHPLHEYLGMMPAVRRAVADRSDALFTLQQRTSDLESKKQRLARLETDITKMLKVDLLKRETHEARVAVDLAKAEYEKVKKRHAEEFVRLERSRSGSFKKMWLNFAKTQVAHAERALQVWRAVAEDLGASPEEWKASAEGINEERVNEGGINSPSERSS